MNFVSHFVKTIDNWENRWYNSVKKFDKGKNEGKISRYKKL